MAEVAIRKRCPWSEGDKLYETYHDVVWGVPQFQEATLFEFLLLEGAQAGLSWITVLRRRDNYRHAFDDFDPSVIARYGDAKRALLLADAGIIRNRMKIDSAINNAQCYLGLREGGSSFAELLWSFVDGRPIQNGYRQLTDIPAKTLASEKMSKELKKRGFSFVGPTICYVLMQATGMVNDHLVDCDRHGQCEAQARALFD